MNLARIQGLSLATKAITTALGIVQSVIVIRLLSPAEYGLVGLVMSIGGVIGVTQHLGIVDGAIREIAVSKKRREIGSVFWVSHLVRQVVTIPLSVGLIFLAGFIAGKIYGRPEITPLIQVFAAVLVLQGLQDVLGATLTGIKKFTQLYIVQIATAAINVAVFGYLTWRYGTAGFFWAIVITTAIMVVLLWWFAWRSLRGYLNIPGWQEIKKYARRVMRIGAYMYAARIFFVLWQRVPLLVLGGVMAAEELGYLNVSLTFGSKLTIIAMALSEVNLSWMSSLYAEGRDEFKRVVTKNMHRVLVLMTGLTLVLLFFAHEILVYIVGSEYLPAYPIILIMTAAFYLYALLDIGTSSVFVSADRPRSRAVVYGIMTMITAAIVGWLFVVRPEPLPAAYGVLAGAVAAYAVMVIYSWRGFGIPLVTKQLALFLAVLTGSLVWLLTNPSLDWRVVVFIALGWYLLIEAKRRELLPAVIFEPRRWVGMGRSGAVGDRRISGIVCFAGAEYESGSWTNRQQIMSRVSHKYPVLYVEPRVWIVRHVLRNWFNPGKLSKWLVRLFWYEKKSDNLYIKSQWNVVPWSREIAVISTLNHWLNRWSVLLAARSLKIRREGRVMWIYDTEGAEYLRAFKRDLVFYDCVDDHAAQAGPDRNSGRVEREEARILARADVVTVTSRKLLADKNKVKKDAMLVLNAGDTELYGRKVAESSVPPSVKNLMRPVIGSVGALDGYKVDFDLIRLAARQRPQWQFVLIGKPVVKRRDETLSRLKEMSNVHLLGATAREDVPEYVAGFDVCMIPYRMSRYNKASFPLKFWEFMATGKPVVVTGLPELREYNALIGYATNVKSFIAEVERALKEDGKHAAERRALARQHSWEKRAAELMRLMEEGWRKRL